MPPLEEKQAGSQRQPIEKNEFRVSRGGIACLQKRGRVPDDTEGSNDFTLASERSSAKISD